MIKQLISSKPITANIIYMKMNLFEQIFSKKETIDNQAEAITPEELSATLSQPNKLTYNASDEFMQLQALIESAGKRGEPIVSLVKAQIKLLEKGHDEFMRHALANGYSLNNPCIGDIEVAQYTAMKLLASKIGLSTEKYEILIKRSRIRIFGEENYKRFFED